MPHTIFFLVKPKLQSKPTQHGVKELRSLGLSPQMILCRSTQALVEDVQRKISGFCHVPAAHVISVYDVQNIYHVPLLLVQQDVHEIFIRELHLGVGQDEGKVHLMHNPDLAEWSAMAHAVDGYEKQIKIALIGKYTGLQDSYLSVIKALKVRFVLVFIYFCCGYHCSATMERNMHPSLHDPFDFLPLLLGQLFYHSMLQCSANEVWI